MISYLKTQKTSTKKFLDIINSFSKVARYKINLQKLYLFYTPTTNTEKEYRKTIPFTIASKKSNT
jgi:hypothetical protein